MLFALSKIIGFELFLFKYLPWVYHIDTETNTELASVFSLSKPRHDPAFLAVVHVGHSEHGKAQHCFN